MEETVVWLPYTMADRTASRLPSILLALLVTIIWSSSWVIIKSNIASIPPLQFAGLRYALAALFLLPVAAVRGELRRASRLPRREWGRLALLGVVYYAVTQGAMFVSLSLLPATELSLIMSFTTVAVAFGGLILLGERPRALQWTGTAVYLVGAVAFLMPFRFLGGIGTLVIAIVALSANSAASLLARSVNRSRILSPLGITAVSMALGGAVLLAVGLIADGLPRLPVRAWLAIFLLAAVNTTVAFTLWNRALTVITALESSVINNTMLFQIAFLSWMLLGETLSAGKIIAIVVASVGVLLVQLPVPARAKISGFRPAAWKLDGRRRRGATHRTIE